MASTQKTPLGLNIWSQDDKPRMEDFNEDNRLLDELLSKKVEVISLELGDGLKPYRDNSCYFWKSRDGIVTVTADITIEPGNTIENLDLLATLPVGYRPSMFTIQEFQATYRNPFISGLIRVYENGKITARYDAANADHVWFQVSFIAA